MRLAMAQMAMTDNIDENADRALAYYDQAGEAGADRAGGNHRPGDGV